MASNLKKIILDDIPSEILFDEVLSAKIIIILANANTLRKLIKEGHKIKELYRNALELGKKVILFELPRSIRINVEKEIITLLKNMNEDIKNAVVIILGKSNRP